MDIYKDRNPIVYAIHTYCIVSFYSVDHHKDILLYNSHQENGIRQKINNCMNDAYMRHNTYANFLECMHSTTKASVYTLNNKKRKLLHMHHIIHM